MIEFIQTPIGIWTGLMALAAIGFLIGAGMSLANSLFGEALAMYSAAAAGLIALFGILPALYLSGIEAGLMVIGALMATVFVVFALFVFVMSADGSGSDY